MRRSKSDGRCPRQADGGHRGCHHAGCERHRHQPERGGRHGAALQQAVEAGIPVVTVDRRVAQVEGILAHVGADNVKGGRWPRAT